MSSDLDDRDPPAKTMRVRLWSSFASNNSGSYTLIGNFESPESAAAFAAKLERVFEAHGAWYDSDTEGDSPLAALAEADGASARERLGRGEDAWPEHGPEPRVLASVTQVLVHVPYTVTMPRMIGELVYRHGGRVDVELDHSHDQLLLQLEVSGSWQQDEAERQRRTHAVHDAVLGGALGEALAPPPYETREPWRPALRWGAWGALEVTLAPTDLVLAARLMRELCAQHGVFVRMRVLEALGSEGDPLVLMRALTRDAGAHRVVLWSAGKDAMQTLRAVREVLGSDVATAERMIADAPTELLIDVAEPAADAAVERLHAAGCDAEVIGPERLVTR